MVGVEHLAGQDGVELLLGGLAPRHGQQPVEVGADHRGLAALLAHALEATELLLGLLAHVVGHVGLFDLRAVLLDDVLVVLAQLLADRLHLLAQEVLALLGLGAGLDVVADPRADLQLGEALALEGQGLLEAGGHVELLQELELLLEGQVGGVARGVGQGAGAADRADELAHAAVGLAQLEDLVDHGAVLALELLGPVIGRVLIGDADRGGAQLAVGVLFDVLGAGAVQAAHGGGHGAAGKLDALEHVGERADRGRLAVDRGDEQDLLLAGGVDRERRGRVGEGDDVVGQDDQGLVGGRVVSVMWCSSRSLCSAMTITIATNSYKHQ